MEVTTPEEATAQLSGVTDENMCEMTEPLGSVMKEETTPLGSETTEDTIPLLPGKKTEVTPSVWVGGKMLVTLKRRGHYLHSWSTREVNLRGECSSDLDKNEKSGKFDNKLHDRRNTMSVLCSECVVFDGIDNITSGSLYVFWLYTSSLGYHERGLSRPVHICCV